MEKFKLFGAGILLIVIGFVSASYFVGGEPTSVGGTSKTSSLLVRDDLTVQGTTTLSGALVPATLVGYATSSLTSLTVTATTTTKNLSVTDAAYMASTTGAFRSLNGGLFGVSSTTCTSTSVMHINNGLVTKCD
jgi:hypothetical protein